MEVAVTRLNSNSEAAPSNSTDTKYQYQRALALSKTIFDYSNDQVKQLQAQSVIMCVTQSVPMMDIYLTILRSQPTSHSNCSINHPTCFFVHHIRFDAHT
jgi:hypothetical protein